MAQRSENVRLTAANKRSGDSADRGGAGRPWGRLSSPSPPPPPLVCVCVCVCVCVRADAYLHHLGSQGAHVLVIGLNC